MAALSRWTLLSTSINTHTPSGRLATAFSSAVHAIAQTPDGDLWIGTELGLVRFDGVRTVAWQPPNGDRLPSTNIFRLLDAPDGRLWIGTAAGLASLEGLGSTAGLKLIGLTSGPI